MAIYDIDQKRQLDFFESAQEQTEAELIKKPKARDRLFSSLFARLFFFLLLLADLLWMVYSACIFLSCALGLLITLGKVLLFKKGCSSFWISLKRSLVCAFSLIAALFAPAFGILIACTYFLMYDKSGIEEVVPSSLQEQFKDFMPHS
jgi:predicted permease